MTREEIGSYLGLARLETVSRTFFQLRRRSTVEMRAKDMSAFSDTDALRRSRERPSSLPLKNFPTRRQTTTEHLAERLRPCRALQRGHFLFMYRRGACGNRQGAPASGTGQRFSSKGDIASKVVSALDAMVSAQNPKNAKV